MVNSCCAVGCTNRYLKGAGISFHTFPSDEKRKTRWIKAVKRKNWNPSPFSVICGKHFQTGKPNADENHPDYVPNVFPFSKGKIRSAEKYEMRKKRLNRIMLAKEADVTRKNSKPATLLQLQNISDDDQENMCAINILPLDIEKESNVKNKEKQRDNDQENMYATNILPLDIEKESNIKNKEKQRDNEEENMSTTQFNLQQQNENLQKENETLKEKIRELLCDAEKQKVQINSLHEMIKKLMDESEKQKAERNQTIDICLEMNSLREKIRFLQKKVQILDFPKRLMANEKLLIFYTGVPNLDTFKWILATTEGFITQKFKIPKEHQLLIVLIKLRHALTNEDLGVRLLLSRRSVERILKTWIPVLAGRLKHLICWPSDKKLKKNLPTCFRNSMYRNAVCVIDCTEIFTQKPSNLKTKNQMWSNYKQHLTLKILVAISPMGQICFLSECWGGRVTDKELTLRSGLLKHLRQGDIILADRGFNIAPQLALKGVKIIVPTYTKGKKQLTYEEVIKSKRISNVRIHIERVIGYMKKFKILTGTVPITSVKYMNAITQICAGIHNLWPPTIA